MLGARLGQLEKREPYSVSAKENSAGCRYCCGQCRCPDAETSLSPWLIRLVRHSRERHLFLRSAPWAVKSACAATTSFLRSVPARALSVRNRCHLHQIRVLSDRPVRGNIGEGPVFEAILGSADTHATKRIPSKRHAAWAPASCYARQRLQYSHCWVCERQIRANVRANAGVTEQIRWCIQRNDGSERPSQRASCSSLTHSQKSDRMPGLRMQVFGEPGFRIICLG